MKKTVWTLVAWLAFGTLSYAQQTFPRNGAYDERPGRYAFTNATIVVDPKTTIQKGTLLIENGLIKEVGTNVKVPGGTVVTDLQGKYIYPSLLELDSNYGMPEIKSERRGGGRQPQQLESAKKGAYGWNQAIQPENEATALFTVDAKKAAELRKLGFGTVLTHPHDGIVRGTGALVTLADEVANDVLLRAGVSAHFSFNKGSSTQNYPNSIMGSVALLRQTYYDADWYAKGGKDQETNLSLSYFNQIKNLPAFFEVSDKLGILRADKVGDEFGIQYIIKSGGDEYQRIDDIKASGASLLVPLTFPEAFDVTDPWDAEAVTLAELKHWEMAPGNPAAVAQAGIPFALTTSGLPNTANFWTRLRTAVEFGLSKEKALEALTTAPARLIKAENLVGSLKKGMLANFLITSDELFANDNIIYENWIKGKPYIITDRHTPDLRGTYNLAYGGQASGQLRITGTPTKPEYQLVLSDSLKVTPKVSVANQLLTITYQPDSKKPGTVRLTGWLSARELGGEGSLPDGMPLAWSATLTEPYQTPAAPTDTTVRKPKEIGKLLYPFVGLGNEERPKAETILFKNATVWTNEQEGVVQGTDVLVQNGKIARIGKSLSAPAGARTIDATGKHLTSGIIDEHSHIALFAVNEGSQSSTAEVRMSDAINSEDINIYRQLAGGVTTSQLLHGSANSIGGQSAVIKLKWGAMPSEMWLPEAKYIKFALGENVKQSNWGDVARVRFPQTRMGVEQIYMDHFIRAREYDKAWKDYNGARNKASRLAPRRDLELEALAEILNNERFITCHSYVQSEINMLMHVADSLKFKVNTFTHILEGYKLADKMAERGIGGSTFSDWWAYKMEVKEAIPYNAALMAREGVVVAINSDDAEMARRLNQEAAKAVAFGGISEEDAWKMVTLNPAKLMHLDQRMGSIKTGKDADLVLWNNHPLSIYARPDYTLIEGTIYFDFKADESKQAKLAQEKARLIQKTLEAKSSGAPTQRPDMRRPRMWHCEDVLGEHSEHEHGK
ncbi:amidohydrolase family protein [Rhabdobacter roseus]|uniref:Imidazolonepropionase-like amidohydrolase n=1 Tax=Rhabdobacter roseus TaxID=1655419 RepID=A0A840TJW4_9BACT|nr:amidohydrolase family protein [Rhabdobacter roseus]MBB5283721.1 imidazolonepropionase-like amidohydrolase [Rhabdobacter roseus]